MEYKFRDIEKKWQSAWSEKGIYKVTHDPSKPKCYVLDMFPYPSGAGLHVGHPLGYIASDIYSRFKRLKGFNVLHPMGFDSFGLPAEQYALDTGQHPAETTQKNIANFKAQLNNIGFCYDWDREVQTSDPKYYKWTQWIFLQLYYSFFNRQTNKAERTTILINAFEREGNKNHPMPGTHAVSTVSSFTADEWNGFDEKQQQEILMQYRLVYCGYGEVNWCEALGTVLANDEVVNGVSERGGYPVVKKKLRQWYLRITEYADRLLQGLEQVDFSPAMKEMQSNWIGKSSGAEIDFRLSPNPSPGGEGSMEDSAIPKKFFQTADKRSWGILKDLSRENRKNKTEAENILWQVLRNNKLGYKVRRQHVIDGFIVDFAFLEKKLLVEVDGGYHEDDEQKEYDEARTEYLKEFGYRILRFSNDEVIKDIDKVERKIREELERPIPESADSPLSDRRGVGGEAVIRVYTTRPDTIFGVDFMVIAPEHELVNQITTPEQKQAVDDYIAYVKSRSERERIAEKKITGVFTGAYAINPFDGREIPIWIAEYVLAGYGTGAIMAVPCGDERDHKFARHFSIGITNIIGEDYNGEEANPTKEAVLRNSGFLNGMVMRGAGEVVINTLEEKGIGVRKVNYKMHDAAFSRQRYWGEPIPIKWINARLNEAVGQGIAYPLDEKELPLKLPHVETYKPGPDGEGPLSNIKEWTDNNLETNTMPGYAGSSWYFLRYMDPHNKLEFCNRQLSDYWNQVDLYIGGTEHAVGHLLYSRMWTKVLFDLDLISFDEPYKKLVNQGMIQGSSRFVYRIDAIETVEYKTINSGTCLLKPVFISEGLLSYLQDANSEEFKKIVKHLYEISPFKDSGQAFPTITKIVSSKLHTDVNRVDGIELDIEAFRNLKPEYKDAVLILEDGSVNTLLSDRRGVGGEAKYICGTETEKMSKRLYNTVNPDDIVVQYGADTFRMYEMFLGPVEASKPWDTKGIEGVHRFLKKFWRLFLDEAKGWIVNDEKASAEELKVLHHAIKKIEHDTERFSFNTAVSSFMIATNELTDLKCHKREILEPLLILLAPYAPHIAEELYQQLRSSRVSPSGGDLEGASILDASYPVFQEKYVKESTKAYPVAINGKTRTELILSLDADQKEVEGIVLKDAVVQKWLDGKPPKKIIYVKNKMINVVV